jgi:hypothetical protein
MMPEQDGGFKVADKRLFTEEGNLREDAARDKVEDKRSDDSVPDLGSARARSEQDFPMTFQTLVFSLSTTAMMQLGILSPPEGGPQQKDLAAAKQTIDILAILQEKTKGNLTSEESQLLEASVYDLKMTYVKVSQSIKL